MTPFLVALMSAAFLSGLVAGFLFAFAAVVMPGIRRLDDANFIRAFQVIDRVIQRNQPLFVFTWVGSVLAVIAAGVLALWALGGVERVLVIVAALVYLLGVQLPTMMVNIPLNNTLQKLDLETMNQTTRTQARMDFEPRWNRWNAFRTVCASLASLLLMIVLLRV
jgi:uncharacterized membrane protein